MAEISRVTRSKEEACQAYDRMSRWYDLFTSSEKKFADLGLAILDVQSGETVLEIGFGTGHALMALARAAHPAVTHGIDLSSKMCAVTEKRLQRAGLGDAVHLQTGDAAKLPYENNYFDAIFISFTLELFDTPEIPIVLGECHRVLKLDGKLSIVALEKSDCRAVRIYEWFHARMPTLVDCRPIHTATSLEQARFQLTKRSELTMWGLPVSVLLAKK